MIFFSRLDGLFSFVSNKEEYKGYLEKLKELINKVLLEKIIAISEEFRQHEEKAGYKNIKKIFPNFGDAFRSVLNECGIDNVSIFSTNYDGLLDTMLTKDGMFIFEDGFNKTERGLMFEEEQFQRCRLKLLHLHGSYKFEENYYGTEKLKKGRRTKIL